MLLVAVLLAVPAIVGPATQARAAPRLLLFHGETLQGARLHITDWDAVMRFFQALSSARFSSAPRAPFIDVGLYWHGPTWEPYLASPEQLRTLPLPGATIAPSRHALIQTGRLYLATARTPAMFEIHVADAEPMRQSVGPAAIELLRQHKIPTAADQLTRR
jgi:hypothetical protein